MDHMFKDVQSLISVKMFSNSKSKIVSMEGAFENCINLINISIEGFDTEEFEVYKVMYNKNN